MRVRIDEPGGEHCIDARDIKPEGLASTVKEILAGKASAVVEKLHDATGKGQHQIEFTALARRQLVLMLSFSGRVVKFLDNRAGIR